MVYSHTQISQYLRCPRSYRYRYLDGWREKDTRAAMVFGRCFETALGAYFRGEDCTAVLFKEWGVFRGAQFDYRKRDSWDRLLHQGTHLLEKFVREDRIRIAHPEQNLQIRLTRTLAGGNEFVSFIDAVVKWMDSVVSLIGKRPLAAMPKLPKGCSHSILNWFAIPGSAEFPM